jgi:hypothetical protein
MATLFQVMEQKITEEIDATQDFVISGGPKDFTEYKEAIGGIRGLTISLRILKELQRNYEGDEDE